MKHTSCRGQLEVSSRRDFLRTSSFGFGSLALGSLIQQDGAMGAVSRSLANPLAPRPAHFPAKAKSVIFIFMQGGLSQVDSFDPKPALQKFHGQPLPPSFRTDLELAQIHPYESKLMASRRTFKKRGQSGVEISDLFEHLAGHADDLAILRSCYHESFIHGPALTYLNTGTLLLGGPSMGSWVLYGLGSETDNLPSYIVMTDDVLRSSTSLFGTGFLPAIYQGTLINTEGKPFQNLDPPSQIGPQRQRALLDRVKGWNRNHLRSRPGDSRLEARIEKYELAFRMQMAAPELIDLSRESQHVKKMYGLEEEKTQKFGRMCLLARRMVERGVRFVQLYSDGWDAHGECDKNHLKNSGKADKPIAALLEDLKQRGILESTLVVSVGEFGRTPVMQGKDGRDHNPFGFSAWMAGGGIQGGQAVGATDDLGFVAVDDKIHVNDLHACMLTLLGLDHHKLTYFFQGLERRLSGVGEGGERGPDLARRLTGGSLAIPA